MYIMDCKPAQVMNTYNHTFLNNYIVSIINLTSIVITFSLNTLNLMSAKFALTITEVFLQFYSLQIALQRYSRLPLPWPLEWRGFVAATLPQLTLYPLLAVLNARIAVLTSQWSTCATTIHSTTAALLSL